MYLERNRCRAVPVKLFENNNNEKEINTGPLSSIDCMVLADVITFVYEVPFKFLHYINVDGVS